MIPNVSPIVTLIKRDSSMELTRKLPCGSGDPSKLTMVFSVIPSSGILDRPEDFTNVGDFFFDYS